MTARSRFLDLDARVDALETGGVAERGQDTEQQSRIEALEALVTGLQTRLTALEAKPA